MNQSCGCGRRHLLLGGLAAAFAPAARAAANAKFIDVHHHLVPPPWVDALKRVKLDRPEMSAWTPEKSLEDMDKAGTATSITSPMPPQVAPLPPSEAAKVARESNEWARQLAKDHPGRFGVFAMLPMPFIDESLKEIEYAFDTLTVDGVGIMTNYGDKWLGYPEFAPVFDELNRRKAVVYTHPMSPSCCVNLVKGVPDFAVDWGADTTRSIVSLIFSGASARYKDVNFIFSHGGGVITAVAERLRIQMINIPPYKGTFTRDMVDHELNRFYYDTAQVANEITIQALAKLVPLSQIVFGTDFPYRSSADHVAGLTARFNAEEVEAIGRGNALRILPAWRSA